jgi:inorganic triphosphatase YgiF
MEIEAKFRVADEQTFAHLLSLTAIGPFHLLPAPVAEQQRNTYFDTPDQRLRAQRYGLRVRNLGARRIATLKGAARVADGVYERDEWEVVIGTEEHPAHWPASAARDRALALLGDASLRPILTIETTRQHIYAARAGVRVAELSLDTGTIRAADRAERFRELEVELLEGGTRTDFDALVALLRERFALVPEDRSKLARGLALLDAQG